MVISMSYIRQTWIDNQTTVTAAHMQHIEDGIIASDARIDALQHSDEDQADTIRELEVDRDQLKADLSELFETLKSSNRYNYETVTEGYYIPYNSTTGNPSANASFCYSDFIDVSDCEEITVSRKEYSIGSLHTVFYDENKTIIPSAGVLLSDSVPTASIPNNANYMRFSCEIIKKTTYKIEKGGTKTPYTLFYELDVKNSDSVIDFTFSTGNMIDWLRTIGSMASVNHWFNFNIPAGTYNIKSLITGAELGASDFKGVFVPDYVTIVGHSKEDTTITCSYDSANSVVSTLNFAGSCGIKNLKIYGSKTRYAIHDDWALSPYSHYVDTYKRIVENCIIECNEPTYGQAYGAGSRSGAIWNFKNTDFIGGFAWHSNTNFTIPNDITLENCRVEAKNVEGLALKSLGSGVINRIHFIGCNIGIITCTEETSGNGIDFTIDGYGNNDIPIDYVNVTDYPIPFFSDKMVKLKCLSSSMGGNDIQVGDPIYRAGTLSAQFGINRDARRLAGIAVQNANDREYGLVLTSGYYLMSALGFNFANGSLLTVKNGQIAVASGSDYVIGSVEQMWSHLFIYLR